MRIRVIVVAVTAAVSLGLTACGDDSASSSEPVQLTVTASEPSEGAYAFDVPDEITGGTVQLTLENTGAEPHELAMIEVEEGKTADDALNDLFASEDGPIPDYVLGAPGGVGGVPPGASSTSTISLPEGTYVYFCTFGEPAHYLNGMLGEVTVTDVGSTAALPDTEAEIDASEYTFDAQGLTAGEITVTFGNKGEQFHHLIAFPMTEGASLDDVAAFLGSEGGGDAPPPVDFENGTDAAVVGPGQTQVVTLKFTSGSYAFVCFLTDREGGAPHFTKGMIKQVDIS